MFKRIAVTNRKLCRTDFYEQVEKIVSGNDFDMVILREKDLDEKEYEKMALKVGNICKKNKKEFAVNKFFNIAKKAECDYIQLSYGDFFEYIKKRSSTENVGVSVHSVHEAEMAERAGASFLIAGHIYKTDCKKGKEPRGTEFLKNICSQVKIPVYAIGGIKKEFYEELKSCGASGACIMSGCMILN